MLQPITEIMMGKDEGVAVMEMVMTARWWWRRRGDGGVLLLLLFLLGWLDGVDGDLDLGGAVEAMEAARRQGAAVEAVDGI